MIRFCLPLVAKRFGFALAVASMSASLAYFGFSPGPAVAAPAPSQNVQIRNFAFAPAVLVVAPGTTVTWRNGDDDPHTIVASDHSFQSGALSTNGAFSRTFQHPGEFVYFCSLHPHMVGRVVVRAS